MLYSLFFKFVLTMYYYFKPMDPVRVSKIKRERGPNWDQEKKNTNFIAYFVVLIVFYKYL